MDDGIQPVKSQQPGSRRQWLICLPEGIGSIHDLPLVGVAEHLLMYKREGEPSRELQRMFKLNFSILMLHGSL